MRVQEGCTEEKTVRNITWKVTGKMERKQLHQCTRKARHRNSQSTRCAILNWINSIIHSESSLVKSCRSAYRGSLHFAWCAAVSGIANRRRTMKAYIQNSRSRAFSTIREVERRYLLDENAACIQCKTTTTLYIVTYSCVDCKKWGPMAHVSLSLVYLFIQDSTQESF